MLSLSLLTFGNAAILVLSIIFWLNLLLPRMRLGPKKYAIYWALFWSIGPFFQLLYLHDVLDFQAVLIDAIWMLASTLSINLLYHSVSWFHRSHQQW